MGTRTGITGVLALLQYYSKHVTQYQIIPSFTLMVNTVFVFVFRLPPTPMTILLRSKSILKLGYFWHSQILDCV